MFQYQGGKTKELPYITRYEPSEFNSVVDLFGGGGSVFLYYLSRDLDAVLYNDVYKPVYELVSTIYSGKIETQKLMDKVDSISIANKQELNELQTRFKTEQKAWQFLVLMKYCMRGMINSSAINMRKKDGVNVIDVRPQSNLLKHCDTIRDALSIKDVYVSNFDYKKLLDFYRDDSGCFIYCDPPYKSRTVANEQYGDGAVNTDGYVEHIAQCMRDPTYKCKIMLNIDFTGHNYVILGDLIKVLYEKKYNHRKSTHEKFYHLIATNYEV